MKTLNTQNWKKYKLDDLFIITRGKRHKKDDHHIGEINYISSKDANNGIDGKIMAPENAVIYKNVLGINNSGSVGKVFYQKEDSIFSDHVTILQLKSVTLTENIAMFLIPILEKLNTKYQFGREMNNSRLSNEQILLPGSGKEPDWNYINLFIRKLKINNQLNINGFEQSLNKYCKEGLDISKWKPFRVGDYFRISRGKRIVKEEYHSNLGTYPVITAKTSNNGIDGSYNKFNCPPNVLTVCGEVSGMKTFYQATECWVLDTVRICKPIFKFNIYIAMFLIPLFEKNMNRYSFGKKLRPEHLEDTILLLPEVDGKPDWIYMENYIKCVSYSSKLENKTNSINIEKDTL